MRKIPRVLLAAPTYSGKHYAFKKWWGTVKELTYPSLDVLIVDNTDDNGEYARKLRRIVGNSAKVVRVKRQKNSRDTLSYSQNYIRDYIKRNDYDYWFSLESDVVPKNKDVIERLMCNYLPVVGGLYKIGFEDLRRYCIFLKHRYENGSNGTRVISDEEHKQIDSLKNGLIKVHGCGIGCTLIRRDVCDRFPFWTDERFDNKHSDVYWYMDLDISGIPVYVDVSIRADHFNSRWDEVEDR